MCLGVPAKILDLEPVDGPIRLGIVDFGGIEKTINLSLVPEATCGDYVMIHAGFAIARIDEESAMATLEALESLEEPELSASSPKTGEPE